MYSWIIPDSLEKLDVWFARLRSQDGRENFSGTPSLPSLLPSWRPTEAKSHHYRRVFHRQVCLFIYLFIRSGVDLRREFGFLPHDPHKIPAKTNSQSPIKSNGLWFTVCAHYIGNKTRAVYTLPSALISNPLPHAIFVELNSRIKTGNSCLGSIILSLPERATSRRLNENYGSCYA